MLTLDSLDEELRMRGETEIADEIANLRHNIRSKRPRVVEVPLKPWNNYNGLVCGTEESGSVSFDIFDASEWPGPLEEGMQLAKCIASIPHIMQEYEWVLAEISDLKTARSQK
jgi:hypothetical protein